MKFFLPFICVIFPSCYLKVDVYHHNNGDVIGQPLPTQPSQPQSRNRYSEIHLTSQGPLQSEIYLISDGNSQIQKTLLGKTPLTIRISPEQDSPISHKSCGKYVTFMFEANGFKSENKTIQLRCFSTEELMEKNPNNVHVTLGKF